MQMWNYYSLKLMQNTNLESVWQIFFSTKVSHSPTDALLLILENTKIYIKTFIKIAPTCFGLRPSSGSLQLSLTKVILMLKQSVKLRSYVLCGGVAACYVQVWCVCAVCCVLRAVCCALCAVQVCTAHSAQHTHTIPGHNMLPHHRITHNYVILPTVLT
jgi:hypothetical protein